MDRPLLDSILSGSLSLPENPAEKVEPSEWAILSKFDSHRVSSDVSLFSSSLPVFPQERYNVMDTEAGVWPTDGTSLKVNDLDNDFVVNEDLDVQGIGKLLPEEDELFSIMNDFSQSGFSASVEQVEEFDLFSSGGGIELDNDPIENVTVGMARANITEGLMGNGSFQYSIPNGAGTVAGEHPFGEHPSRTLFVRNINSNVEDSELRSLFEQYGDIRSMYTHCKHRGFVMISYFDIRHARNAMRALQNRPLRRRKLDIHFSIPKDNPSDKDLNQGTLVVFNLDPSVSNDDLRQIFGAFGEVKEIRETPHKRHHKFIEYYDVRAAEDALHSLNRIDIAGKRIKLEPSRPGGARRNMIQQLSQELESDEMRIYRHQVGSPLANSPPGTWAHFSSPVDNSPLRSFSHSPIFGVGSPIANNHFPELTSIRPPILSNSSKIAPIGKEQSRINRTDQLYSSNLVHGVPFHHSHSFPEHGDGVMLNLSSSPCTMASFDSPTSSASEIGTLSGPQFLWGSPNPCTEHNQSSAGLISSLVHPSTSNGQRQGYPYSGRHGTIFAASQSLVGSAPSGIPYERHVGYTNESSESFVSTGSFGSMGICRNDGSIMVSSGPPISPFNASPGFRMMSSPRLGQMFFGNLPFTGHGSSAVEGFSERGRIRRADNNGSQLDSKKQFQLDLDRIISGEDTRTTLMIKNIPNKYTSKMLLAAIDENHRGTYDFLYLPIDFKNKCNVGYAFINMASPSHIISFYQAFNGKKWEKFNSEKVASLAYARIQGKAALVAHFQNSSLMNEDKRCRPIVFNSEGLETSDQEHEADGMNPGNSQQVRTLMGDSPD